MPILCICNDKYSQKLKSLKNHCIELEFRKPPNPSVVKRMQEVGAAERSTHSLLICCFEYPLTGPALPCPLIVRARSIA